MATAAKSIGDGAVAIPTDVSDSEQVQRLFEGLERVDLLVTCAGAALFGAIDTVPVAQAKSLFEGRFFGQLAAAHYAVPKMPPGSVNYLLLWNCGLRRTALHIARVLPFVVLLTRWYVPLRLS